jgi:hypothetical protein
VQANECDFYNLEIKMGLHDVSPIFSADERPAEPLNDKNTRLARTLAVTDAGLSVRQRDTSLRPAGVSFIHTCAAHRTDKGDLPT